MSKRSTKLEALNDIFKENDITQVDIAFRDDLIWEINFQTVSPQMTPYVS